MDSKQFVILEDLEVYKLAREMSRIAWRVYSDFDWHDKKTMGDQFLSSTDSIGANIAEGYGRFHYLDKIKFYYYSKGSYMESCHHWLNLLHERNKINIEQYNEMKDISDKFYLKLNNFISATYKAKVGNQYS